MGEFLTERAVPALLLGIIVSDDGGVALLQVLLARRYDGHWLRAEADDDVLVAHTVAAAFVVGTIGGLQRCCATRGCVRHDC